MTRRRLLEEVDAEEMAYWRAKYDIEDGFGEHKADRRTAYQMLMAAPGSDTTFETYLGIVNPSLKWEETPKERKARVRKLFAGLAAMAPQAPETTPTKVSP